MENTAIKKKKIMLLGGLRYLLPVIEEAHKLGLHVITCDYIPDNIAHKYSDEYHNISIIDKEAVLKLARELQIDGIMSFAVDPGVVTAAYVQEKMGLPAFGPYESVCILQDKARFRNFLKDHGFNCPWSFGFDSVQDALNSAAKFTYPAIVKPTDAAGSKGVTRIDTQEELQAALEHAMKNSLGGHIIVEEFLEKNGCSSDTDSFLINGEFKFVSFSAQRFDQDAENPYTPAAYSWPSTLGEKNEIELQQELQRLVSLLEMKTCLFNIECRHCTNGKNYIMEVTPRGGGNRLSELLQYATGESLISNSVRACVGLPLIPMSRCSYKGHWIEIILHSSQDGFFDSLFIQQEYEKYVVEIDLWIKKGDFVNAFRGANDAIGTLILNLNSDAQVEDILSNVSSIVKIITNS